MVCMHSCMRSLLSCSSLYASSTLLLSSSCIAASLGRMSETHSAFATSFEHLQLEGCQFRALNLRRRVQRLFLQGNQIAAVGAGQKVAPTEEIKSKITSLRAIPTLHTHELTTVNTAVMNSSMVFEWLGAYDCSTSFALRALSTCLCVKLHLSASRSRELKHRFC